MEPDAADNFGAQPQVAGHGRGTPTMPPGKSRTAGCSKLLQVITNRPQRAPRLKNQDYGPGVVPRDTGAA